MGVTLAFAGNEDQSGEVETIGRRSFTDEEPSRPLRETREDVLDLSLIVVHAPTIDNSYVCNVCRYPYIGDK